MAISRTLANGIIQQILGGISYTPPGTWYFGLSSLPITNGTIQTNGEPPAGIGYSRVAIPNTQLSGSTGSFTVPTFSSEYPVSYVTNAQTITMDEITGGSEPEVQYFFLSTNAQNSNTSGDHTVQIWGSFDRARTLQVNSNLIVESGGALFEIVNV